MAYQLLNILVRDASLSKTWYVLPSNQIQINDLLNRYWDFYLVYLDTVRNLSQCLSRDKLMDVKPKTIPSPYVGDWLTSLGHTALPGINGPIGTMPVSWGYTDAWQGGYHVTLANSQGNTTSPVIPTGNPDLLLTKEGIDLYQQSTNLLTTVNGFLHLSSGSVDGLYVLKGGLSTLRANMNHAGLISLAAMGGATQIPIRPDMLYQLVEGAPYRNSFYLNPGVSLTGKSVFLSIGGYLHALDNTYSVLGDMTIKVDFRRIPLPERLFDSYPFLDLSSLPLKKGLGNPEHFTMASIYSDATIKAYLTLPQSFVIVVNTDNVYRVTQELEVPTTPGRFFNQTGERLPLLGPGGRLYDYRQSLEDKTYVYGTESMAERNYLFQTTDNATALSISDGGQGYWASRPAHPCLLDIGTFV